MKRIILLLSLVALTSFAQAQNKPHRSSEVLADNYTQGVGWIHTHIATNWYLSLEGGGHLYYGYEDRLGAFPDRISTAFNGYIGRWVFPMIGIRIGAGYATYNGFLSKTAYDQYDPRVGYGSCDYRPDNTALGGYYHFYSDDLYHQTWKAIHLAPDLMLNLSYANFYNPRKILTTYAYLGVAYHVGLTENAVNLQGNVESSWRADPNTAASLHVGLIENVKLGQHFQLYGDVRLTMYEGRFDREDVAGVEKGLRSEDFGVSANVGLTYNFHLLGKERYADWYRKHINPNLAADAEVASPDHLFTSRNVDIEIISTTDTIWTMDTLSEYDPRFVRMVDSLADLLSKDTIDKLLAQYCDTCPLREILAGHTVPYEMVFFELDKWDIHTSEALKIAKMARLMRQYPEERFLLLGSADSKTGTPQRNEFLSVNRADVVYNKLVFEYDIPAEQLQRVYLGGILNYDPYELNRATVIIMDHPQLMQKFLELRADGQAGGADVRINK